MSKVVSAATEGDIAYGVGSRGDRVVGAADGVAEIVVRRTRRCWLYAMVLGVSEVRVGVLRDLRPLSHFGVLGLS